MPSPLTCSNCGADNQAQASFCRACGRPLQTSKPTLYSSTTGQLLANIVLNQRYRIIKPIGQGGFGAVYQAVDTKLGNRPVAIKEMLQNGQSSHEQQMAADAFKQEAIILAHLEHPNLPRIFEHFEENGRWYLVMSFLQGETLENYLHKKPDGQLPLGEVVDIGTQLCTVLDYLHQQRPPIIFRDLKPANIMRTSDGHIYLIDFGIARHFKPGQSKDTTSYGSDGYAPPEQYGKAQTTPRSDIYSLGATLHQLLSGRDPASTPFHFPPLHSLAPAVPLPLATFITQMLEMDEAKRPPNVLVVKQELQTFASPPSLLPPGSNITPVTPLHPAQQAAPTSNTQSPMPPTPQRQLANASGIAQSPPRRSPKKIFGLIGTVAVALLILAIVGTLVVPGLVQRSLSGNNVINQIGRNILGTTTTSHPSTTIAAPTPTPTPLAPGTTIYQATFDQADFSNWSGANTQQWKLAGNGEIGSDGTADGSSKGGYIIWYQHDMPIQNYEVTAQIQFQRSTSNSSNDWELGIMVRGDGNLNGYEGGIVGGNGSYCHSDSPEAIIALVQQDSSTTGCDSQNSKVLREVAYTLDSNTHTYLVKVQNNTIQLFLDGQSQSLLSTTDNTMIQPGRVGLRSVNDDINVLSFTITAL